MNTRLERRLYLIDEDHIVVKYRGGCCFVVESW
jgi:hypothetical protein